MGLLSIAKTPAAKVAQDASVLAAVREMAKQEVGAVAITKDDVLVGVFTERDLMLRVVVEGKNPETTPVSEVMTKDVVEADTGLSHGDTLRLMLKKNFRHLPVVDENRKVLGMISLRTLLNHRIDDLTSQLDSMVNYLGADGIGG